MYAPSRFGATIFPKILKIISPAATRRFPFATFVSHQTIKLSAMVFLEFEQPLESLYTQLEKIREVGEQGDVDVSEMVKSLETKIRTTQKEIYGNLTGWQKVQLSRHPNRPYTLHYINHMCKKFVELHGDRCYADDKAIVGGIGSLDGQAVMLIGHQKGVTTKMRQYRNFGMANPEGYRKALRLMKLAERFGFPVVTLIDTPGAYPGVEAEQRGQAEAIARNLIEMAQLRVPIVCVVIGEGASGGAIGIGLGDRVFMLENTWYSVISPESCSSILWRSWEYKEQAAEALKLTADHMYEFGIIDGIIKEPTGGAHSDPEEMAKALKRQIKKSIAELQEIPSDELIQQRIDKYAKFGHYSEAGHQGNTKRS
jgi:acetyl-CoA carboxylase carboxyl transferase subunit alpha